MRLVEAVRGAGHEGASAPPHRVSELEHEGLEHEELVVRHGARSGVPMAVAIHSTVLGPALGGLRLWHYDTVGSAIDDVLRLAQGMTLKAAAAGLDLGGGKGVICSPGDPHSLSAMSRRDLMLDFGDLVESLEGRYITAEDVGTGTSDMVTIAQRTSHVTGLPDGAGDPSPFTAIGVESAMRACVEARFGSTELRGLGVVVIGLGHVGARLAKRLRAAGVRLEICDVDVTKRELAESLGARWIESEEAIGRKCDVLAPCALGGLIDEVSIDRLRAGIVCGAANNQLADDGLAEELEGRGILYAPDFLVNAGGLISVYRELHGYDEDRALELVLGIEDKMRAALAAASARAITPLDAARELALERLGAAVPD